MKKKYIYLVTVAALAMASCSEEEMVQQNGTNQLRKIEITAGMPDGESRTSFTNGGVLWQENDALNVFVGGNAGSKFTINDADAENEIGPGYNMAKFSGSSTIGTDYQNNVAYYPYTEGVTLAYADDAYTLKATFPAEQQFAEAGSFGQNSLPMIAVTETTAIQESFQFKTLGGWLQLYVKGDATITKVVMKAKGHKIAGDYTVTASCATNPVVTMGDNAVEEITLNCGEGVELSTENATLFTFAVPPFTFGADEVSFDIYDDGGAYMENAYTINKGGTIIANAYYTIAKSGIVYEPNAFVQGYIANGVKFDEENGVFEISTAAGLRWYADSINNVTPYANPHPFEDKTVKLVCDIDLEDEEWIPIGDDRSQRTELKGTFDGNDHIVSNIKISKKTDREDENKSSYGFFGNVNGTVKNLTVENVSVSGAPKFIGALVGRMNGGLIENCHVKNSSVECNNWTIGGVVGQWNNGKITGCSIENTTIKGYAGVGAIAGLALNEGERDLENCSVKNCTIVQNGSFGGDFDKMFGVVLGAAYNGKLTVNINECIVENTTINDEVSQVYYGFAAEGDVVKIDGKIIEYIVPGLVKADGKEYIASSAAGLVHLSESITLKGGESISLGADIDLTDVEFGGLSALNPEINNTFDGKEYTVSNWTYEGGASDMGFIKNWVGSINNINFENCHLKTAGRSAIVAAKVYGNISNINVNNCTIEDSYWASGIIAGLYNSGSIDGCTVTNSSIKSNGGTAAIVGVINETGGERKISNCKVEGTTVNNTGTYGEGYSGALFAGMFNVDNAEFVFQNNTFSNNTIEGQYIENGLYYINNATECTIWVDGVKISPSVNVNTQDVLATAVETEGATVKLAAGNYTFPSSNIAKGVTIICEEGTVFEGKSSLNIKGATVVGATFSNPSGTAVDQTINGTFKNCTFTGGNGLRWCYAGETSVFEDCVFDGDLYGAHFDGGENPLTFRRCTFSGFNAFGGAITQLTLEDCIFKANGKSGYNGVNLWGNTKMTGTRFLFDGSATEFVDPCTSGKKYEFTNCKVNDQPLSFNDIGAVEGAVVIVDGLEFIANGVAKDVVHNTILISNKDGMMWFANEVNVNKNAFSGKTVQLVADIDLAGIDWEPIGQTGATTFNGIFDGKDHTISNLSVNSEDQTGKHYSSGLFGWVESHTANHGHLKNVKISGATIKGHHNCGALVGYITQETALVENCHVTGATVSCTYANGDADGDKAGALIGNATVATPVKNCTAEKSTVSAGRDAGQVIGAGREANVTGCSATEVTVTANGTGTGNNVRNEVIGRLL